MANNYTEKLEKAQKAQNNAYFQLLLKSIIANKDCDDIDFIKKVLFDSIPTIRTNDQKKTMKRFAKELITDKAFLKEFNDALNNKSGLI